MTEPPPTPPDIKNIVGNLEEDILLPPGRKLPTRLLCARFNVCDRTIARWQNDPDLNFPSPIVINGRKYFDEIEVVRWERDRASRSWPARGIR
jgi:hypothetical protein